MSFLVCFDCRNRLAFIQVSERGDIRDVSLVNLRYQVAPWGGTDERAPGFYCGDCGSPVDTMGDEAAAVLADDRVDFVPYHEFAADALFDEFARLIPDAEWTRLDMPPTLARYAPLDAELAPPVADALQRLDRPLYLHQAMTIGAALARQNVVLSTAAGSGKSIGYQVPVLDAVSRSPRATALLVFPMRALAMDQMKALAQLGLPGTQVNGAVLRLQLTEDSDPITVARHDGATLDGDRRTARAEARIVLTTPDSLHRAILANCRHRYRDGTAWERFLQGLRLVVLDEVHFYRGVFGSAVAQLLRRLRRAADREGGDIRWLASSATIGNAVEHAERLTGVSGFTSVGPGDDGAARARRVVVLCNPPRLAEAKKARPDQPQRQSPTTVGLELMAHALASSDRLPVRTICFGRSRNEVHTFTKRVAGKVEADHHRRDVAAAIGSYTATLLSEDREEQENRLKDGRLLGIVSTNALELGIDIPDLSFALLVGYPGQLSSFRQRAGRVGRRGEGLAVLVVGDDPLQQHLVRTPEYLDVGEPEHVVISVDSPEIIERYGLRPAQEESGYGICAADAQYFGSRVHEWIAQAHAEGVTPTIRSACTYWMRSSDEPAHADLRMPGGAGSYTVIAREGRGSKAVGTIDSGSGPRDCFVDAVWVGPDEKTFVVKNVNHQTKEVLVDPANTDYVTRGLVHDSIDVTEVLRTDVGARFSLGAGTLSIRRSVYGYKRVYIAGGREETVNEITGWGPRTFTTKGLWIDVAALSTMPADHRDSAIVSTEHVLLSLLPTLVAADPVDFESHASPGDCRIYLYDSAALGIGLVIGGAYERIDALLRLALDVVSTCTCADGCPGCVYLSRRPDGNAIASRVAARGLLMRLVA